MSYYGPVTDPLQDTPFLCTHNKNAYHLIQAISECVCARASPVAAQLSLCCFLVFTFLINLLLTWYHSQFLFALYPFQQLYSTVFNEKKNENLLVAAIPKPTGISSIQVLIERF